MFFSRIGRSIVPCRGRGLSKRAINTLNNIDPEAYTSGHWLRHDARERNARHVKFDFQKLCSAATRLCSGAKSIQECQKVEGGFNKAFIFKTDNGMQIVARLPTSVAGPARLTTNSEVALITYLQSHTTIPIPKILDWNDDPSNDIGSEYIIMEHSPGIQLHQIWPSLSLQQKIKCIDSISRFIKQMVELEFPAYGSIYFSNASFLPKSSQRLLDGRFSIGPHCGTRYWDCNVDEKRYCSFAQLNQGPWHGLAAYCKGLIETGLSRLPPPDVTDSKAHRLYQGTVPEHLHLLSQCDGILSTLIHDSRIQNTATPTLLHADLNKRNIFVSEEDPTVITGFIDWQSTSIQPAFEYASELPDYATPILEDSESEQEQAEIEVTRRCAKAYDASMKFLVPRLAAARDLDEDLLSPFRYSHRTWRDGIAPLEHELMRLHDHWTTVYNLPEPCAYSPPIDEKNLLAIRKRFFYFETYQKLKDSMTSDLQVPEDGWVPNDQWEQKRTEHQEAFDIMAQVVGAVTGDDADLTVSEMELLWPFDLPADIETDE